MKLCGIVNNGKNSPRRVHVASATIFLMHPCAQKAVPFSGGGFHQFPRRIKALWQGLISLPGENHISRHTF